jgi:putative transposase
MPFKNAPRAASFAYVGLYRYFLTICTDRRQPVFTTAQSIELPRSQLLRTSAVEGFVVVAYCFMPDHLHLLVEATADSSSLLRFVKAFKQQSSYSWKRARGGQLWQRSYFDRVLRDDEDSVAVARYILANPVRAGFCTHPLQYKLLGSGVLDVRDLLGSV